MTEKPKPAKSVKAKKAVQAKPAAAKKTESKLLKFFFRGDDK